MEPANLLRIKSLGDGWCDKDVVMLHSCFQLLEDCVEQEELFTGHTDWEQSDEYRDARVRLQGLYDWWQERKRKFVDDEVGELQGEIYREDTRRLVELVTLRHMLWT